MPTRYWVRLHHLLLMSVRRCEKRLPAGPDLRSRLHLEEFLGLTAWSWVPAEESFVSVSRGSSPVRFPSPRLVYTETVITQLRERIARVLAFCVFVITFGRVHVNATGTPTASDVRRGQTHIAAKRDP